MELIDKAAVMAEIEKRISLYKIEKSKEDASKVDKISLGARIAMLEEFKIFLDTLEGKRVGLEKIIEQTYHDRSVTDTSDIDHISYENIAEYFFELGLNTHK